VSLNRYATKGRASARESEKETDEKRVPSEAARLNEMTTTSDLGKSALDWS